MTWRRITMARGGATARIGANGGPRLTRFLLFAALIAASAPALSVGASSLALRRSFEVATAAWERGDYGAALAAYIQVVTAPGGDAFVEPIALTTGELFDTRELTTDGRAPRFSVDGKYIAYETGLEISRRTRIFRNPSTVSGHALSTSSGQAPELTLVADLPGVSATFSSTLNQVAYLKVPDSADIRLASAAIEQASLTARNRTQLTQTLSWLIASQSVIVTRDLRNGREMELPAPDLIKSGLVFNADGRELYFLGGQETQPDRTDIYTISENAPKPVRLVDTGGLKSAPIVDPAGKALLYLVPALNPLRRPATAAGVRENDRAGRAGDPGTVAGPGQREGNRGGRGNAPQRFAIVDLATRQLSTIVGTAPSLSADGRTLVYVVREGAEYSLMVGPTTGIQAPVKRSMLRLDAPSPSADGSRVVYQMMPRDDWEIFVADRDGANERQLTRDIEHDVLPRFIAPDRVLAMIGEPRHRRSYLYDLASDPDPGLTGVRGGSDLTLPRVRPGSDPGLTPRRKRVFHNNTVRMIAPEYSWAVSPDGTKILIGAERDGNTVSPARGVYLVDLQKQITKTDLISRLRTQLRSELILKRSVTRMFQPLTADVRQVLARESESRIFGYEKALFDFDSKSIARPGNRKASAFLFDTYKSFGYQPEYQWFDPSTELRAVPSAPGDDAAIALDGKTANVIATLRGTTNPDVVYVVSSHYDSVDAGPGADDDSSGTAALLEAARVLANHPLPATIVFASFTGEEAGLLGSREFVRRAVAAHTHVAGALNNDMIGWTNDGRLDNTIRYSNPGIRDIQHGAAMLFTRLITYDALYFKGTDAASLYDAYGDVIGGIGSYPVLASPHYHQASDRLEFENHQLILETARRRSRR